MSSTEESSAISAIWRTTPRGKMQKIPETMMETFLSLQAPNNAVQRRKNRRYGKQKSITYLGLIAHVIQGSPDKMLTFSQLMDKLEAFISGNRKGIENNIRVCLSSHDCFVKVPVGPYVTQSKKNFWKVDESRISAKMARRNFKGILDQFPDLSTKVRKQANQASEASERLATIEPPAPAIHCPNIQKRTEGKFTSSFSIESILNQKSQRSCPQNPQFSAVSTDQLFLCAERGVDTKRRMIWDSPQVAMVRVSCPDDSYPSYVTWGPTVHVIGDGRRTSKMMRMCVKPSYPTYFRPSVAPCFVDRYSKCDVGYPVWT